MSGKKWAAAGLVVALVGGYGALDAYDIVPGVLTIDHGNHARTVSMDGHTYRPLDKPASAPALPAAVNGPAPSTASVKSAVDGALKNSWFGNPTAVTVLDADTGAPIYEKDSSRRTTPASVTKLLSAYAIAHSKLPQNRRLTTKTVLNGNTLDLVAGGDMVLSDGKGDPTKVAGHAGLQDLADQTATSLKNSGRTKITVNSNTSDAPGPATAKGWGNDLLSAGYTARITTLGLAKDRADNKTAAVADPTKSATQAFVDALKKDGIDASYGSNSASPVTGSTLGSVQSAPVLDILGLALQDSDNAMVESLARQAAALDGVHGDSTRVGQWVVDTAKTHGVDVTGVHLADACGLSDGTTLPVRVLGQIVAKGSSGKDAAYQAVISRLPVAGWNGTVAERFSADKTKDGQGVVHAKTGSLTGVSSLAGETVTRGNHRVVFAVTTNGTFSQGPDGAKAAIDQLVTGLTDLR